MHVLWEDGEPLLQEADHLARHLIKCVHVAVAVYVAESSTNRVVNKQEVREFIPGTRVVLECLVFFYSVRPNFHHGAVHGAATWPSIQP